MTLERAIAIAAEAHAGQKDKVGAAYILHSLRVMMKMETEEARIAAVLHDVVEDSEWSLDDLRKKGFSEKVLHAVDCLTRRDEDGEDYFDYVKRAGSDPIARKVKLADLADNSDLKRLGPLTENARERQLARFRKAAEMIS